MMVKAPLLRALCVAHFLAVVGCSGVDPEAELQAAADSVLAARYDEASIRLSNVVQAQPQNAEARRLRGELALLTGDYPSAADDLERARALGADVDSLAVDLADAWTALGQLDEALDLLDAVAATHASDSKYWVVRADALVRAGRYAEAEDALDSGARVGDMAARGEILRASLAVERGNATLADDLLTRAIASSPTDAHLLVARANLLARTERFGEASADLSRAAELYRAQSLLTRELTTLVTLAQVQLALNDLDALERTAAQLVERAPEAPLTSYFRGLIEYRRGRFNQAADLIQPLASALPEALQFRSLLGAIHLARGELGQAEQQLQSVLARSPRDPAAIKLLAETRLRQQRPEAALSALRGLESSAAEDAQVGLLSGLANLLSGNTEEGLVYLEQAAALDPTNELLKVQLARAYLVAGRSADASTLLQEPFDAAATGVEAATLRLFAAIREGGDAAGDEAAAALLNDYPREPRALTAGAIYFQLRGDSRRARQLFEQAAELETDAAVARMFVAAALVQEGRREDAERLLARVVEEQPENADALSALAELSAARGAFDEAAELLSRAVEHSTSVSPRLALAQLHLRQGDHTAAREQLDLAAQAAPDNPEVSAVSGILALAEGRARDAISLLERAQALLPNRLGVTLALARAQLAGSQPDAARATVLRVLAAAPRSLPLRLTLGEAELRLGNADQAFSIAASLKADYPAQSAGYVLEADAQIATRRYAAAAETLATAFEREPAWPVLSRLLKARQLAGQADEALRAAQGWAVANPRHVPGVLLLAGLLQEAQRDEEALDAFKAVIDLDANNVVALNNAAWLSNELGGADALDLAERAWALAPDSAVVLDTLGWVLLSRDREVDALPHLARAAELVPDAPELRYHLARALAANGQLAEARSLLTDVVGDTRDFEEKAEARHFLESL